MKEFRDKIVKAAKTLDDVRKEVYKPDSMGHSPGEDLLAAYNARDKSRPGMAKNYQNIVETREKRVKTAVDKAVIRNKDK
jgi:hypothetical protein